jgi:hypothetical protein
MTMKPSFRQSIATSRRERESGVTIIETLIATVVLSVGLVGLAQLFIVASYNNSYAVATSGGVNDAQRLVEYWKAHAGVNGFGDGKVTSSMWDESTGSCTAFADLKAADGVSAYDFEASAYKPSVWVYDHTGTLVGTASEDPPSGFDSAPVAPADNSRYVYIRMEPRSKDPRYGQAVTLSAIVGGQN